MSTGNLGVIDLAAIINELRTVHDQRATGTYFIVSAENRQVRLGFVDGELDAISIRAADAPAACDAIAAMQIVRTAFSRDKQAVIGGNIKLSTDELFRELLRRVGHTVPGVSSKGTAIASLSRAQNDLIRKLFIEYLGPIGEFIYEEHQQERGTMEKLLTALAKEIPDRHNAEQFLSQVRTRLAATQ
jgi:hypothetical protein